MLCLTFISRNDSISTFLPFISPVSCIQEFCAFDALNIIARLSIERSNQRSTCLFYHGEPRRLGVPCREPPFVSCLGSIRQGWIKVTVTRSLLCSLSVDEPQSSLKARLETAWMIAIATHSRCMTDFRYFCPRSACQRIQFRQHRDFVARYAFSFCGPVGFGDVSVCFELGRQAGYQVVEAGAAQNARQVRTKK